MPLRHGRPAPARPVVSLLTDFGWKEPFVGLVKARVLEACPAASIVDLTHDLPPFAVEAAAFWISRSFQYFPAGTVHLCIVDPGVGTGRRILVAECAGHCLVAPDNGLLAPLAALEGTLVRAVDPAYLGTLGPVTPSATFHGRDLFAPLAGRLAAGSVRPAELGGVVGDWARCTVTGSLVEPGRVTGSILFEDSFGNLFSSIESKSFVASSIRRVRVAGRDLPWVRTYGDAPAGSLVALENSFSVVEIACVKGSAAAVLGVGPGEPVEVILSS